MAERTELSRGSAITQPGSGRHADRANDALRRSDVVLCHGPFDRRPLAPADLIALQRTMGNRATTVLLNRAALAATIQRQPTAGQLRAFSERYFAVLHELRKGVRITKLRKPLIALLALAEKYALKPELPSMFQQVTALAELAAQESSDLDKLKAILSTYVPEARTGGAAYSAFAGATFTPEIQGGESRAAPGSGHGGGEFVGEEMQKREKAEGKGGGIDIGARINLIVAELAQTYRAHRARFDPHRSSPFDRTLLVFVGPEWFFRRPDRPYTREELRAVIQAMVEISLLFPEMLIMPGTVVAADKSIFSGWKNLTNTAIVVWNGNLLKTIDKASDCGDTYGLVACERFLGGTESPLLTLGDLTFALDICVDFMSRRAQKAVEKAHAEPDIHILTSAGQGPNPQNTATRHGGFLLSADSTGGLFPADLRQLSKNSEGRSGEKIKGTVLEQDTGNNKKMGLLPLLTYYDPRSFAGHGPGPDLPSHSPSVTIIDARSGDELERRQLAAVSSGKGKEEKEKERETKD